MFSLLLVSSGSTQRRDLVARSELAYRVLSNAGAWFIGRLQTDAYRDRVVEAVASEGGTSGMEPSELAAVIKKLAPRWFVMRNGRAGLARLPSRTTLS